MTRTKTTLALALMLMPGVGTADEVPPVDCADPLPAGAVMRLGTRRFRHGGAAVTAVAYSPDGKVLASGGGDTLIRFWDPQTGKELRRLSGHTHLPTALAFLADGKRLASVGEDATVRLWDVDTGKLLRTIKEEMAGFSVAFSRDGQTVVVGSGASPIHLWDAATGKLVRALEGHSQGDIHLSLSPDGKTLASAGWGDGMICLWDMVTGKLVRECGDRMGVVSAVRFSPDGTTLATGCGDGWIHLWDPTTGKGVRQWKGHPEWKDPDGTDDSEEPWALAFTPDGRTLLSAGEDGTIREWDAATGQPLRVLARPPRRVYGLSVSPDGKTVASGSWDTLLRRWDLASGKEVQLPRGHEGTITSVRFGDDDKTVVSTAEDGTARTWEAATGKELRCEPEKRTPSEWPPQAALSMDGRALAVSSDETVRLQDSAKGKPLGSFRTEDAVKALRFSPDGKTLAASTDNNAIHLWDVKAGKERCCLPGVSLMVFSADSRLLAAPEADAFHGRGSRLGIRLWDPVGGKQVGSIPSPNAETLLYPLCFSADGRMLAGWAHNTGKKDRNKGSLAVWEVATG
jgi:WD40 repeat protein